jgi:hypothetical protein
MRRGEEQWLALMSGPGKEEWRTLTLFFPSSRGRSASEYQLPSRAGDEDIARVRAK